uniref:Pecanex_C domain-containing protein n=1 Tax=Macrostomum lignano TaxID=282301 RepID=A0A1I8FKA6_9PLAT
PWRYVDSPMHPATGGPDVSPGTGWSAFVESNAHFYADLWLGLLRRLARGRPAGAPVSPTCCTAACLCTAGPGHCWPMHSLSPLLPQLPTPAWRHVAISTMSNGCGSGAALWWQRQAEVTRLGAELLRACVDAKRRLCLKSGSVAADSADNNNYDDQADVRTRVVDYLADSAKLLALAASQVLGMRHLVGAHHRVVGLAHPPGLAGTDSNLYARGSRLGSPIAGRQTSAIVCAGASADARRQFLRNRAGDARISLRWLAGYPTLLVMLAAYAAYSCLLGYKSLALFCLLIAFTKFCLLLSDVCISKPGNLALANRAGNGAENLSQAPRQRRRQRRPPRESPPRWIDFFSVGPAVAGVSQPAEQEQGGPDPAHAVMVLAGPAALALTNRFSPMSPCLADGQRFDVAQGDSGVAAQTISRKQCSPPDEGVQPDGDDYVFDILAAATHLQ